MNDFSSATKLRSERGRPPFFADRSAELAALRRRFDDLCETGDATEGLALIVGVPGIGKTQLGRRFVEEVARRSMPEDEAAPVVNAAGGDSDAVVETAIAHGVLTLDAQGDVGLRHPFVPRLHGGSAGAQPEGAPSPAVHWKRLPPNRAFKALAAV